PAAPTTHAHRTEPNRRRRRLSNKAPPPAHPTGTAHQPPTGGGAAQRLPGFTVGRGPGNAGF
ncbi:hypothetical protein, partial [Actinophytocola sp.]|uniref:hypothetical protein n=1 Tax=Actinophytocola sp. TaxID=1872138 RepID=UPI002ED992E5